MLSQTIPQNTLTPNRDDIGILTFNHSPFRFELCGVSASVRMIAFFQRRLDSEWEPTLQPPPDKIFAVRARRDNIPRFHFDRTHRYRDHHSIAERRMHFEYQRVMEPV